MFYVLVIYFIVQVTGEFYNSKYDDFDVQSLIENDRILLGYTKCFLDQGPCTPDAKDFKKIIPEALETSCGKCTKKQKELIRIVIRAIMERHPKMWDLLTNKFDKDMKYRATFDEFITGND